MRWVLWSLAVVVPLTVGVVAEVALLLVALGALGPGGMFLWLLCTGLFGAYTARIEGARVWAQLRDALAVPSPGKPIGERFTEGVLVGVGGLLLIVPGILSDVVGIALLLRPVRRRVAARVAGAFPVQLADGPDAVDPPGPDDPVRVRGGERKHRAPSPHPFASPFDDLP